MLTSGTTGPPKRIPLAYEAFERTIGAAGRHYKQGAGESEDAGPRLRSGVAIVSAPFVHMVAAPLTHPLPDLPFDATAPALIRWSTTTFAEQELTVLGDERLRYDEAGARSAELARSLLAEGVGKGTRVGVLAPNGPDAYVALMAVTRIGAVAVPINTFYVASELAWTSSRRGTAR